MTTAPTTYNNDRADVNSWIVYINGLQVPAAGVSTSHGVWQIPQATINLAPDPALTRLGAEDRVMVQVFYCDQWYRQPAEFCLLFDGEIVAWSYASAGNQRMLAFQCIDYVQILTQLFFFFMSSFDTIAQGVSGQQIGTQGNTMQMAGYGALYPYSLFSQGLADPGDSEANETVISRPIDFAYNIVRSLIKAQHPNRTIPAANFFAPWCKRTNFHRRWIALPYFDSDPGGNPNVGVFPILRAVQAEQAIAAVVRMATTIGNAGSMWDMLRDVLMTMMMEVSMIPTPSAVQSDFQSLLPKGPPTTAAPTFLANYFVKPQLLFGLPPACNVFFPGQTNSYTYNENYITQPTRMYFNEEALLSALSANASEAVQGGLGTLMQDALTTAWPEEVNLAARTAVEAPGFNGKNLLVYPEEFYKGPVIDRRAMPRWFAYLLEASRTPGRPDAEEPDEEDEGGDTEEETIAVENPGPSSGAVAPNTPPPARVPVGVNTSIARLGATGAMLNVRHAALRRRLRRNVGSDVALTRANPARRASARQGIAVGDTDLRITRSIQTSAQRGLNARTSEDIGEVVPPQVYPCRPAAVTRNPRDTFWFARSIANGYPTRIHLGHDIVPEANHRRDTIQILSTTPGRIWEVLELGDPILTGVQGNTVVIQDAVGGLHIYYHLESIDPAILAGRPQPQPRTQAQRNRQNRASPNLGMEVAAGTILGVMGASGLTDRGKHLHYGVETSRDYRMNYTRRLRQLHEGAPVQRVEPVTRPPGVPAPSQDAPRDGSPRPDSTTSEIRSGDTIRNTFQKYAAYEYYKERYARRQGAVSMAFNPYPVAGFPCATFDRRSTAVDSFGYIMSVRQNLTPTAWSTDVAFSHGRTMQEMFALVQRTYALEAARLGLQRGEISDYITAGDRDRLAGFAVPIGAIATAPAEPITEIGDVIQNFDRAERFYGAVFHQRAVDGADAISAQQAQSENDRAGELAVPYESSDQFATHIATLERDGLGSADSVQTAVTRIAQSTAEAQVQHQNNTATSSARRPLQRAVFRYPDIIDLVTPQGNRYSIEVVGADGLTQARLLRIVGDIRLGAASETDLNFFREATSNFTINQPEAGAPIDEVTEEYLAGVELELRTRTAATNVRGDAEIVPRVGAEPLFTSVHAALRYAGRPVCTLDEYVDFLGAEGLREGPAGGGHGGPQLHPAHFYTRIRRLRSGPPHTRPLHNYTNTSAVSDVAAGSGATVPNAETEATDTNNVSDRYRTLAEYLVSINPELESSIAALIAAAEEGGATDVLGASTVGDFESQLTTAAASSTLPPDVVNRVTAALERTRQDLGGEIPYVAIGAPPAPASTPTTVANAPPLQQGTYPVDGVPENFPDTRADWDGVLERYRYNKLSKQSPHS